MESNFILQLFFVSALIFNILSVLFYLSILLQPHCYLVENLFLTHKKLSVYTSGQNGDINV